jgi:hypothetical protein
MPRYDIVSHYPTTGGQTSVSDETLVAIRWPVGTRTMTSQPAERIVLGIVQRSPCRNSHTVTVGSPVPAPIAAAGTGEVYALSS